MKFKFVIEDMKDDAFVRHPESETSRLLEEVAGKVEMGIVNGVLHDYNGNKVGSWEFADLEEL